jgi:ferredoxin
MNAPPRTFTVQVLPAGLHFEAREDQTLLQAALAAGVRLPSSCRNGTCRACLCVVPTAEGQAHGPAPVAYTLDWPGLSAEEKAEGCTLPCVAQPRADLALWQPGCVAPAAR